VFLNLFSQSPRKLKCRYLDMSAFFGLCLRLWIPETNKSEKYFLSIVFVHTIKSLKNKLIGELASSLSLLILLSQKNEISKFCFYWLTALKFRNLYIFCLYRFNRLYYNQLHFVSVCGTGNPCPLRPQALGNHFAGEGVVIFGRKKLQVCRIWKKWD
jgi:hypothetical protein